MVNFYTLIPAVNEESSIGKVLVEIPDIVSEKIVINNGSIDKTAKVARENGATVINETERGYGAACLKGLNYVFLKANDDDVIVFLDGDYSDFPEEMIQIIKPIIEDGADMVIGSRITGAKLGKAEAGALLPQALFGNWLSTKLIKLIWNYNFTDLGPFRAIKVSALKQMKMADRNYGWTVEMQVKAAKLKMKCTEIPVSYRKRIGKSKVSGTLTGSFKAGVKILWIIFIYTFKKI